MDRTEIVDALDDAPPWDSYPIDDPRRVPVRDGTNALVHTGTGHRGEQDFVGLMTSVYVRSDDGWRLALCQQTHRSPDRHRRPMRSSAASRPTSMTDATNFTGLSTVAIPVTDQDRTRALLEDLGFETRYDGDLQEGFRWVELAPPDGGTSISLVAAGEALPAGIDTGIRLVTPDARATHAELRRQGLPVGELLDWDTAPLMFSFCDPDGNRLYVAEPS